MQREWKSYPKPEKKTKHCLMCDSNKIFSKGLCAYHAKLGYAKKSLEKKKANEGDVKLEKWYRYIYDLFKGVCQESGEQLPFDKKYCHHLISKAKYPYFKYDIRNGILVNLQTHSILDHTSSEKRAKLKCYPKILKTQIDLFDEVGLTVKADELRKELVIVANKQQIAENKKNGD